MTNDHDRSGAGGGEQVLGRDPAVESLLAHLDPARSRPDYWLSLRHSLVTAARFELARRRHVADLTVAGVVTSWARAVVPSAMVAAAAAVAALLIAPTPPVAPIVEVGVEELLSAGLGGDAVPANLDEPSVSVTLAAAEIF